MTFRHRFDCEHMAKWSCPIRPLICILACLLLSAVYIIIIIVTYQRSTQDELLGPATWPIDGVMGIRYIPAVATKRSQGEGQGGARSIHRARLDSDTPSTRLEQYGNRQPPALRGREDVTRSYTNQTQGKATVEETFRSGNSLTATFGRSQGIKENKTRPIDFLPTYGIGGNISRGKNVDFGSGSYKAVWVESHRPFQQRISWYNVALSNVRQKVLEKRRELDWKDISENITTLWCNRDDFHQELDRYQSVAETIALEWDRSYEFKGGVWDSETDTKNLLINQYYTWTGSTRLCSLVKAAGGTRARYGAVFHGQCTTLNTDTTHMPSSKLEPLYLHGKPINKQHYWPNHGEHYPAYFYTTPPPQVFYMHVIQNAVVTSLGDVLSASLKLVPYSCSQDLRPGPPPGYHEAPLFEEIFIMAQYWGESFFHKMLENFPRVAPYMEFLTANPSIPIHAAETSGYTASTLSFLGLNPQRLVKGTVRAKVAYLPQATPCGFAHIQSSQLLARLYHQKLAEKYGSERRQSIVLIRRSGSRRFTQHVQIQNHLEDLSKEFNLTLELFIDNPSPPMEEAMRLFRRAVVVVAPHGAGLSNIIYSHPGTFVVEGVCNPPHVNLCYQWAAHVLGHRYHGVLSRRGCETVVDVDHQDVGKAVRGFLATAIKPQKSVGLG